MRSGLKLTIVSAFIAVAACTPRIVIEEVEFVTSASAGEPNLTVLSDGSVIMTWFEGGRDVGYALRFARRYENGWSQPRTITEQRPYFVNWADFPSLTELSDGTWAVYWPEKTANSTYAYHVLVSLSRDEGGTWSEPIVPHRDNSPTEHGFVAFARSGTSTGLVWLDGRNTDTGDPENPGPMTIQYTTLDPSGTFGPEELVDGRVCDCCQNALAAVTDGLVVAYRDRSEEEIRDVVVRRRDQNGWGDPLNVGNENWYYPACPVNGPALSSMGDTVVIAWFSAPEQKPHVMVAFSTDGGRSFSEPLRVDDGYPLGRVDVELLPGGSAVVTWMEQPLPTRDPPAVEAWVMARLVRAGIEPSDSWVITETSRARAAGFPRVAQVSGLLLFAWTDVSGDQPVVRVARGRLRRGPFS